MLKIKHVIYACILSLIFFLGGCALFRQAEQAYVYELQIKCPPGPATAVHNIPEILAT